MGVPNADLLTVAGLLGTKVSWSATMPFLFAHASLQLTANEFVAYQRLQGLRDTMTPRGFAIA